MMLLSIFVQVLVQPCQLFKHILPAVQGLQLIRQSVMSLHCSQMPRPTQFSSLTICTTGSPCFASVYMPTPTANPSFISAATSATSVPSSVVASTKFSTSFTVLASICWPSESTLALYMGSLHSKLASSQLNNGCVL